VSAGATVVGTATATAANGVATFSGIGISGIAGTSYTLSFGSGALTSATQSITPTAGAPSQLVLTTAAATAKSDSAFRTQPVVAVRDAAGNTVTSDNSTVVTMTVSAGATVVGTATATAAAGVATFGVFPIAGVGITGVAGTSYTLTFSSGALTPATQTIIPSPGAGTHFTITTQPSAAATTGVAFPQQPVLQLRDNGGNIVNQSGVIVTATIGSGTGTLGGTVTLLSSALGVVAYTNLSITGTGDHTITFTATLPTPTVTSNTITLP
jgi:hypothetical protein